MRRLRNARVRAFRELGRRVKILSYSPYDDTGAFGYRMATAFNKLRPDWEYRAVRGAPSYLQFPAHTEWDWPSILKYWNTADVVHVHDHLPKVGRRRPTVVTFHGTGFREDPAGHLRLAQAANAVPLVSTLDLWLLAPDDVEWAPQIDDVEQLASYRIPQEGPLRIGHAPTNRLLKSTDLFLAACDRLKADGLDVEVVLIEGKPWAECLPIKGTCDIFFDQTAYGYGGNAIEAWAMGIPVICGAPEPTLTEYERRFGRLPFVLADPSTIYEALCALLNPADRTLWGVTGRRHVETYHSQLAGVERLTDIYTRAAGG